MGITTGLPGAAPVDKESESAGSESKTSTPQYSASVVWFDEALANSRQIDRIDSMSANAAGAGRFDRRTVKPMSRVVLCSGHGNILNSPDSMSRSNWCLLTVATISEHSSKPRTIDILALSTTGIGAGNPALTKQASIILRVGDPTPGNTRRACRKPSSVTGACNRGWSERATRIWSSVNNSSPSRSVAYSDVRNAPKIKSRSPARRSDAS